MEYASILISWGFNAFIVDVVLNNFIENDVLSYLASLLVVGLFAGLFLTPPGTLLLRIQNGLREPSRMEHQRVDPIFDTVYKRAKRKSPHLPNDICWFTVENDQPNAIAVGRHTVAITTGLLAVCTDSEIAAALGHEFGHIAHLDVVRSILTVEGNFIFIIFKTCVTLGLRLLFTVVGYLMSAMDGSDMFYEIFSLVGKAGSWITNLYLTFIYHAILLLSSEASKKQEYSADMYSAELGFCRPLIHFLSRLPTPSVGSELTLLQMLYGTHPDTGSRIERLKAFDESN